MSGPSTEEPMRPDWAETEDERRRREYHEARRAEVQEDIDQLAELGIPARAHWEDHITAWTGFVIVDPADIFDALTRPTTRPGARPSRAVRSPRRPRRR